MSGRRAAMAAVASAASVMALAACTAVSEDGPHTPTYTESVPAAPAIDGMSASVVIDGWACYSLTTDDGTVELVSGLGSWSEPDADHLVGPGDGALQVGTVWRLEGGYASGPEIDDERGACPLAERYFVTDEGEEVDPRP